MNGSTNIKVISYPSNSGHRLSILILPLLCKALVFYELL